MKSALIISNGGSTLAGILERINVSCACVEEVKNRNGQKGEYDLYIIDTPDGENTAVSLAKSVAGQVVLLTDVEKFEETSGRLAGLGIIAVQKPVDERALWTAVKTAEAAENRISRIISENQRLKSELEDLKVINRAKIVLVTRMSMTEPEAHRYIEKQAMDMRQTRRAVAESILKTYEY